MADGVITTRSLIDEFRNIFNDVLDSSGNAKLFSDVEYTAFLLKKVLNNTTNYTLQRATPGFYYFNPTRYLLNPGFAPDDDTSYTVNAIGPSVQVTSGSDASTTISLSGASIDFPEAVVDVCQYIMTNKAQEASMVIGDGEFNVEDTVRKLTIVASYWRGVVAI